MAAKSVPERHLATNFIDWNQVPMEVVNPLSSRQIVPLQSMKLIRRKLAQGAVLGLHRHLEEQVSMIETGKLRFVVVDTEYIAASGDVFVIASNVLHSVEAMEESVVTDVFAIPPGTEPVPDVGTR
jgi:quercetin dioxygenase-like cupin family protein